MGGSPCSDKSHAAGEIFGETQELEEAKCFHLIPPLRLSWLVFKVEGKKGGGGLVGMNVARNFVRCSPYYFLPSPFAGKRKAAAGGKEEREQFWSFPTFGEKWLERARAAKSPLFPCLFG